MKLIRGSMVPSVMPNNQAQPRRHAGGDACWSAVSASMRFGKRLEILYDFQRFAANCNTHE
jgi:hypothetical protein